MDEYSSEQIAILLADPTTAPRTLADIAAAHHELWPQVAVHPNAYPALIEWMQAQGFTATRSEPAEQMSAAAQANHFVSQTPATQPNTATHVTKKNLKTGLIIGIVAACAVVIGVPAVAIPLLLNARHSDELREAVIGPSTEAEAPPEAETLGVRVYEDLAGLGEYGPKTMVVLGDPSETIYASQLDVPWTLDEPLGGWTTVEQSEESPSRAVGVSLDEVKGSGLTDLSTYSLNVNVADIETRAVTGWEQPFPLPEAILRDKGSNKANISLRNVEMLNGVIVVVIAWTEEDASDPEHGTGYIYRAGYSITGDKLWERKDPANIRFPDDDTAYPLFDEGLLIVGEGLVVFGIQGEYAAVDVQTGEEVYRKSWQGEPFTEFQYQTGEVFVVGQEEGKGPAAAIRIADGESFGITNAKQISYDPVGDLYVAAYPSEAEVSPLPGSTYAVCSFVCQEFDPSKPRLQVLDASGAEVFSLSVAEAKDLDIELFTVFDERMLLRIGNEQKFVSMRTGEPVPGIDAKELVTGGMPGIATKYLASPQGSRDSILVVSDSPLSWDDFTILPPDTGE